MRLFSLAQAFTPAGRRSKYHSPFPFSPLQGAPIGAFRLHCLNGAERTEEMMSSPRFRRCNPKHGTTLSPRPFTGIPAAGGIRPDVHVALTVLKRDMPKELARGSFSQAQAFTPAGRRSKYHSPFPFSPLQGARVATAPTIAPEETVRLCFWSAAIHRRFLRVRLPWVQNAGHAVNPNGVS